MDQGFYKSYTTVRGPSPLVFQGIDRAATLNDPNSGLFWFDDFCNISLAAAGTTTSNITGYSRDYYYFAPGGSSAGGLIQYGANTAECGEVKFTVGDQTDECVGIHGGPSVIISPTYARKVAFECRLKVSSISTNAGSWFCGLFHVPTTAELLAATVPMVAGPARTAVLSDHSAIGFHRSETSLTAVDLSYSKASGTEKNPITGLHTLVADTYVRLGFTVDFDADNTKCIKTFINGAEYTTAYVTKALATNSTDFPGTVAMKPIVAIASPTTSQTDTLTLDWWALGVKRGA